MNVYRVANGCLVVTAPGLACLVDPVLVQPFAGDTCLYYPRTEIELAALQEAYNAIVFTSDRPDSFCLRTLHLLDRNCPIIYPKGSPFIGPAAEAMGFTQRLPAKAGQVISLDDLRLAFTPVPGSERALGVVFAHAGSTFCKAAGSRAGREISVFIRDSGWGAGVDLLAADFSSGVDHLIEFDLERGAAQAEYARAVEAAGDSRPTCVTAIGGGYQLVRETWSNSRASVFSEHAFLEDVRVMFPGTTIRYLEHGSSIEVTSDFPVERACLPFVRLIDVADAGLSCRSDGPMPELVDSNPFGYDDETLRGTTPALLEEDLQPLICAANQTLWKKNLADSGVVWRLEVVYPDLDRDIRYMDFRERNPAWAAQPPRSVQLLTVVPASTLLALTTGEMSSAAARISRRVSARPDGPMVNGTATSFGVQDEPIAGALFARADQRHFTRELRRLCPA